MDIESYSIGSGTAYWITPDDGGSPRNIGRDTSAYQTYRPDDDPRLYCDKCSRCLVYHCDGRTATHHFIHIDELEYFTQSDEEYERRMSPGADNSKHADRDRGV